MLDRNTLGEALSGNVQRLREQKGWTQQQLADQCGVNRVHINRIEKQQSIPNATLLFHLADALGVSTDSLRQVSTVRAT